MKSILVTGARGQLGSELRDLFRHNGKTDVHFAASADLDITDEKAVEDFFVSQKPAYLINCAAYTAVDKAESETEKAFLVNAKAPALLAEKCKQYGVKMIHISTDFVFEGNASFPLQETDAANPLSVYGASKLKGEQEVLALNSEAIIIRTGWLYSSYGNNFVKTMIRLCETKDVFNVVFDQVGTPTYAADLAEVIEIIIDSGDWIPGIYHFSNEGVCSWYDFAVAIRDWMDSPAIINPIRTAEYPTPAKRPAFSVLDKAKIKLKYGLVIPHWFDGLNNCLCKIFSDDKEQNDV